MKNENTQQKLIALLDKAPAMLNAIKPVQESFGEYKVTVKVAGYVDLMTIVADLIKLCTLALTSDEPHISPLVKNGKIDIPNILELALQLIPYSEAELLDTIARIIQEENR
mgnify:CR=1 FL=1